MIQKDFAANVVDTIKTDENVIGLAAAGSWITGEIDKFSDLDLVLITREKIGADQKKMEDYARSFGEFISGFTGEHVGEPRVLICLFDNPLLHVDIKFLTLGEFEQRIENPVILFEREQQLTKLYNRTHPLWPTPNLQWIEDRFWTWVHYVATKAARGEYFECIDALGMIRSWVLAPLLQLEHYNLPRGMRKLEFQLPPAALEPLKTTLATHNFESVIDALENSVNLYQRLQQNFPKAVILQRVAAERGMQYLSLVKKRS